MAFYLLAISEMFSFIGKSFTTFFFLSPLENFNRKNQTLTLHRIVSYFVENLLNEHLCSHETWNLWDQQAHRGISNLAKCQERRGEYVWNRGSQGNHTHIGVGPGRRCVNENSCTECGSLGWVPPSTTLHPSLFLQVASNMVIMPS